MQFYKIHEVKRLKINSIKLKKQKKMVDRENLVYKTNEYTCSFKNFWTINTFGRDVYYDKITSKEAERTLNFKIVF